MGLSRALLHPAAKPLAFALGLLPAVWLVGQAAGDQLGANPQEALIRATGDWALRFMCLVLAVTPLRMMARLPAVARFRRMLGLFAFFYAVLHLLAYAVFDMGLELPEILRDIAKRPFILVGTLTLLLILPLALTSFNRAIRWLGAARWQKLHRLVYLAALTMLLHFFWMRAGKSDFAEVAVYATIVALLLGWRLWQRLQPSSALQDSSAPRDLRG
ncbi:MAG: sulfite oxidase heme-binding subunit YedZ [Limnohabitans sp.]